MARMSRAAPKIPPTAPAATLAARCDLRGFMLDTDNEAARKVAIEDVLQSAITICSPRISTCVWIGIGWSVILCRAGNRF